MAQKPTRPKSAQKPAAADAAEPKLAPAESAIMRAIEDSLDKSLESQAREFIQTATEAEKQFLYNVWMDWDSNSLVEPEKHPHVNVLAASFARCFVREERDFLYIRGGMMTQKVTQFMTEIQAAGPDADFIIVTDAHTKEKLEICLELLDADTGCNAPFESFFRKLITLSAIDGVTPEDVESELEEFREDMQFTLSATHRMLRRYPSLAQPPKESGGQNAA